MRVEGCNRVEIKPRLGHEFELKLRAGAALVRVTVRGWGRVTVWNRLGLGTLLHISNTPSPTMLEKQVFPKLYTQTNTQWAISAV